MNKIQKISIIVSVFLMLGYNIICDDKQNSNIVETSSTELFVLANSGIASGVKDGTYSGSGRGFRGNTVLEVTVVNEKIIDIEIKSYKDDKNWFKRAKTKVINYIISDQSTEVDTVAGATYSSKGIINAVKSALENAK